MRKLALAPVSYRDGFLILYRVYMMMGHFISRLFVDTLHVDKIHVRLKIAKIAHALPVPVHQQTDFTPKRVVVSRLHDTVAKLSYRCEILALVQQPGRTHAGVTCAGMTLCIM